MKTLALLGAVAAVMASTPAAAAFVLTNFNADGYVVVNSPTSFTVFGGDMPGTFEGGLTTYGMTSTGALTISGGWMYETFDSQPAFAPLFDPAGYFINSAFFQLSDNFGPNIQSGTFSFRVNSGDTFGFYVATDDNIQGRGSLTVTDYNAVPEPASWAMLIAGFGLVGAVARRRRSAVTA